MCEKLCAILEALRDRGSFVSLNVFTALVCGRLFVKFHLLMV